MNDSMLSVLRCPACGGDLTIAATPPRCEGGTSENVVHGILRCSCGAEYAITDGVPRLLEPAFTGTDSSQAPEGPPTAERTGADVPCTRTHDPYSYIRESFSREWKLFDYTSDKTWGWTLDERKEIFLDDLGMSKREIKGKNVLDAGCGNGTLTAAVASFKVNVVGVDLNDGLGTAWHSLSRIAGKGSGNVEYVQGNLANPPFKPGSFDIIYCSGVLHHTPDTRESFKRLVPLVKPGGRMYIWVYGKRNVLVRAYADCGRGLKRILSPQGLLRTCRLIAPFYKVGASVLNACGISEFRKRTVREITLDLFDAFAPEFNHRHTEEEVHAWFQESGFTNITPSGKQKHGFGMYGDKVA